MEILYYIFLTKDSHFRENTRFGTTLYVEFGTLPAVELLFRVDLEAL